MTAQRAARAAAEKELAAARAAGGARGGGGGSSSTDLPDAAGPPKRKTQKDLQEEQGGAGVYSLPLQTHWELKQPEWVNDIIPEIMDGKNILDFVDPEIESRLAELEEEEEQRVQLADLEADEKASLAAMEDPESVEASRKVAALAKTIRKKKGIIKEKARVAKKNNHPTMSRAVAARAKSVGDFVEHMGEMGVKTSKAALRNLAAAAKVKVGGADALPARDRRSRSADAPATREGRSLTRDDGRGDSMDVDGAARSGSKRPAQRANSVPRDRSSTARDQASVLRSRSKSPAAAGVRDDAALKKVEKVAKQKQFRLNKMGRASESDRHIHIKKPKHLFSGKRGIGKTDRR